MKLSRNGYKTFYGLFIGSILISIIALILYQHLLLSSLRPQTHPRLIKKINQIAYRLQKKAPSNWPAILKHPHDRRLQLSTSDKALYKKKSLLPYRPSTSMFHSTKGLAVSIALNSGQWLNVRLNPPKRSPYSFYLSVLALGLFWLGGMGILCRWAIIRLDAPMKQLIDNLDYANQQEHWQSIPLLGNEEQNTIFEKVNILQEKVNKLLSARTHMLAAISHDLRTPLTRIKLRAEYFQGDQHYPKLLADVDEMESMISESLEYFQDINHEESEQSFDLIALVHTLCEDAQDLGYPIQLSSGIEQCIYKGRFNLLKRTFNNILHNAIKYGREANVSIKKADNAIKIIIDDEGPGLESQAMEQAFTPYYRVEDSRSRQTGGTGLGLSIAKEIIQLHHGSIQLNNRPEGGLRVTISLKDLGRSRV